MNKLFALSIFAVLVCAIAGCQPRMDQVEYSSEEQAWQRVIRDNYPGYRPPPTPPRAVHDSTLTKEASLPSTHHPDLPPPPAGDPVAKIAVSQEIPTAKEIPPAVETAPATNSTVVPPSETAASAKSDTAAGTATESAKAEVPKVEPPDPTDSIVYIVKSGDTLGALAKKFYGDARRQDIIRRANLDLVNNPNRLYPGMKLFIPKL